MVGAGLILLLVSLLTPLLVQTQGQQKGVEKELLSSSQQRSQKPDAALLPQPGLEKQPSGLKCGLHPIDLKSPKDALPLGFFSQIAEGRQLVPRGQPWQRKQESPHLKPYLTLSLEVSLELGHFHFCGGSLVREDVVTSSGHCMVNLEQKLLKSLVVTAGEYRLQWADRQEQSIPVSRVTIHPVFNRLCYMDCDVALLYLQHPAQYGEQQPKGMSRCCGRVLYVGKVLI